MSTFYVGGKSLSAEDVARRLGHQGRVIGKVGLLYRVEVPSKFNLSSRFPVVLTHGPSGLDDGAKSIKKHLAWLRAEAKVSRVERETDFWEALEDYVSRRADANGYIDFDALQRAIDHRDQMALPPTYLGKTHAPVGSFEFLGPRDLPTPYRTYFGQGNLSGRKNGVTVGADGTVYVASAGGGIWRSRDGGVNFTPLSDAWPSIYTSCVVTHPISPSIVLAGTGDKNRFPLPSMGIMRSTDGGDTWSNVTTGLITPGETVTEIVFDPVDPNIVIAGTTTFNSNQGRMYRSLDAGQTWAAIPDLPVMNWNDIDVSGVAGNGNRTWWAVGSSANGPVIFRTYTPAGFWIPTNAPHTSNEMRVNVAASKLYPGTVYLVSSAMDTIYKSTTYGSDWASIRGNFPMGTDNLNWSQDTYDIHVTCTTNGTHDRVWVGLLTLAVSHNSGASWVDVGRTLQDDALIHNDQHDLCADPTSPTLCWAVNDGGLYRVNLQGNNVSFDSSPNRSIYDVQAYRMSIHPSNNAYLTIGTQDNASPSARGNFNAWWNLQAGDGGFSGYHPTANGRHLSSGQGGLFFQYDSFSDNEGDQYDQVPAGQFLTPMVYGSNGSPYAGTNALYRWDGDNWLTVVGGMGIIQTIERGKSSASKLFIGNNNGQVYRSSNLGPNRVQVGAFTGGINDIDESPMFPDRLLVAVQNGPNSSIQYCLTSNAATPLWGNVTGSGANGLPRTTYNAVAFDPYDPGTFYVGTDVGLFITTDYGQNWFNMNPLGLPNVQVNAIEIDPTRSYLYVATFGRGVWRVPLRSLRLERVTFAAPMIFGGTAVDCTFQLFHPAPPGGVRLGTTWSSNLVPPAAPVVVPAGQRTVTVRVNTRQVLNQTYEGVTATLNDAQQTGLIALQPIPRLTEYTVTPTHLYGGEDFEGRLTLNTVTPLDVWVLVQSDPALILHNKYIKVRAGLSSTTFYGVTKPVTSTQTTSTTASYGGGSATQTLNIYPVPSFTGLSISPSRVYGGTSTTGTLFLSSPAPLAFFFGVATDSPAVVPPTAGSVSSKATTSAPFTLNTIRRIADTTATVTTTFLNRTASQTVTVMAYPLLTQFTLDKNTIFSNGVTQGRAAVNVKVRHPGLDLLLDSDSPLIVLPGKLPIPIGENAASFDITAGFTQTAEVVTLSVGLDGKFLTRTITVLP